MRGDPVILPRAGGGRRKVRRCFYFRSISLIPGLGFGNSAELLRDTIDGNAKSWDGSRHLWAWELGRAYWEQHNGHGVERAWRGMAFSALGITIYNGRTLAFFFNTASSPYKKLLIEGGLWVSMLQTRVRRQPSVGTPREGINDTKRHFGQRANHTTETTITILLST